MGLNLAVLLSPWVIFGITSIVVVTVVIILTLIEKIIDRKIRRKNEEEENFFREKIDYLKSEENKRSKLMFSVAFVVLMILLVSVFFGWRHRVGKEREERFLTVWPTVISFK